MILYLQKSRFGDPKQHENTVKSNRTCYIPSKTTRLSNSPSHVPNIIEVWLPSKTTRLSNITVVVCVALVVWLPSKTTRLSNWRKWWRVTWWVWLPSKTTRLSNLKWEKRHDMRCIVSDGFSIFSLPEIRRKIKAQFTQCIIQKAVALSRMGGGAVLLQQ